MRGPAQAGTLRLGFLIARGGRVNRTAPDALPKEIETNEAEINSDFICNL